MLEQLAGRKSVSEIAKRLGRSERTVQAQISARGLPVFTYQRKAWTRRDWLLSAAAGLVGDDGACVPYGLEHGRPV